MYQIKTTRAARKLAKKVSAEVGVPRDHILLESRSSADRQVQAADVQRWHSNKVRCEKRREAQQLATQGSGQLLRTPQYGRPIKQTNFGGQYPAVEAWCEFTCSAPAYTAMQVLDATYGKAPPLAAYRLRGRWVELTEIKAPPAQYFFRENYPELATEAWGQP